MASSDKPVQQFSVYLNDDNKWIVVDYPTGLKFKGSTVLEAVDMWIRWLQLDADIKAIKPKGEL